MEETTACIGCHGGTGATVDATFSFARKLGDGARASGWYSLEERGASGIPEPRRADGRGEYEVWLEQVGGGDDFRTNTEVEQKFFGAGGKLKPEMVRALAKDISVLIVPRRRGRWRSIAATWPSCRRSRSTKVATWSSAPPHPRAGRARRSHWHRGARAPALEALGERGPARAEVVPSSPARETAILRGVAVRDHAPSSS